MFGRRIRQAVNNASAAGYNANLLIANADNTLNVIDNIIDAIIAQGYIEAEVSTGKLLKFTIKLKLPKESTDGQVS